MWFLAESSLAGISWYFSADINPLLQLQAPDIRAFLAFYFGKNLSTISFLNPNPLFTCKSLDYSRFPCDFHSTLTSAYPSLPPLDSTSLNTSAIQVIYNPATRSIVTKRDPDKKKEPDSIVENSGSVGNLLIMCSRK